MKRATFGNLMLVVGMLFYVAACSAPTETELKENYNLFQDLEVMKGAEQTKVTIHQGSAVGRDAYFEFDIDNISTNLISPGVHDGWCIEWTKPIAQQGDVHDNLQMYSTFGKEKWKPLNYFLNIKEQLKEEDPELTYREFQAVIWSVTEGPEFDLNNLSIDEIPTRLLKDGEPNFRIEKINTIVDQVRTNSAGFTYTSKTQFALFMQTGDHEQDIMVPSDQIDIEELGTLPGKDLYNAYAINNNGQATGFSNTLGFGGSTIFIWEESTGLIDLGKYHEHSETQSAEGLAINDHGVIAGRSNVLAVTWDQENGIQSLGSGRANGINNNGIVVGQRTWITDQDDLPKEGVQAVVWDENGDVTVLETFSEKLNQPVERDWNEAHDINNHGQIVGSSVFPVSSISGPRRAVVWEDGKIVHDLGTFGGSSEAFAINDMGQVVGMSEIPNVSANAGRAFIWDQENGLINLGTIDEDGFSRALDINNHGQVVGEVFLPSDEPGENRYRGFYWDADHGMIILEPFEEDFFLSEANGINDDGVIVGRSSTGVPGEIRAVKWEITFAEGNITAKIATRN